MYVSINRRNNEVQCRVSYTSDIVSLLLTTLGNGGHALDASNPLCCTSPF